MAVLLCAISGHCYTSDGRPNRFQTVYAYPVLNGVLVSTGTAWASVSYERKAYQTDTNGQYTVLLPQGQSTDPVDAEWVIEEPGSRRWVGSVPHDAGPHDIIDLGWQTLVPDPTKIELVTGPPGSSGGGSAPSYGLLAQRPSATAAGDKTMYFASDAQGGQIQQVQSGDWAAITEGMTAAPAAHAASHGSLGSDPVSLDGSQVTSGVLDPARLPQATTLAQGSVLLAGDLGGSGLAPTVLHLSHVTDGSIGASALGSGSVGTASIQNAAVGTAQLADASITNAKLALATFGDGTRLWDATSLSGTVPAANLPSASPTVFGITQLSGDLGGTAASPQVLHLGHVTDASLHASGIAAVNPSSLTGTGTVPVAALPGATTLALGAIQLAGDLGGTSALPRVLHLTSVTDASLPASGIAAVNPSSLTGTGTVPVAGLPAATGSAAGIIQISGDLGGTSTSPQVVGGTHFSTAITTSQTLSGAGTGIDAAKLQGVAPSSGLTVPYASLSGAPSFLQTTELQISGLLHTLSSSVAGTGGTVASTDAVVGSGGKFVLSLATQSANTVLAGPSSGVAAAPTMRALVAADLPSATTSAQGIVRLAGDLAGTATSPTVANLSSVTNGSLPASGIAAVNPSSLTGSGTVPLAALTGLTTSQLSATAGIVAGQITSLPAHAADHFPGGISDLYLEYGHDNPTAVVTNVPRMSGLANGQALATGTIYYFFLTPRRTVTVANAYLVVATAATTTTGFQMALMATSADGVPSTLMAVTTLTPTTDTTGLTPAGTMTRQLNSTSDGTTAAPQTLTAGTRYCLAVLWTGTGSPVVKAQNPNSSPLTDNTFGNYVARAKTGSNTSIAASPTGLSGNGWVAFCAFK